MDNYSYPNDMESVINALELDAGITDPTHAEDAYFESSSGKEQGSWKDLKVQVQVILGTTRLSGDKISSLKDGSIIIFEEEADEFVDIFMNGKKVAKGRIATVEGNYAIQIVHILDKKERIQSIF